MWEHMQALHGDPSLLTEKILDRSPCDGNCCSASNWRSSGFARGYSRLPGAMPRWMPNGQPREVYVFDVSRAARE